MHKKHKCSLRIGSNSMLLKTYKTPIRNLLKSIVASPSHPDIYDYFRSYPAVVAERQRQHYEGFTYVIHPLSWFSFISNSIVMVIWIMHIVTTHFRLTLNVPPIPLKFELVAADHIILVLDLFCLINICITFNKGYVGFENSIIMNRPSIVKHYFLRWFFLDLLTSLPIAYTLLLYGCQNSHWLLAAHMVAMLKIARTVTILQDLKRCIKLFVSSYIWQGVIGKLILFVVFVHVCCCYLYICPVVFIYRHGYQEKTYSMFLPQRYLHLIPVLNRYKSGIYICLSAFFGASYHTLFTMTKADEIAVVSSIIVLTSLFVIDCIVFTMKLYFTWYDSTMRYYELMNEVEAYMTQKQFPSTLKRRVIAFYNYTFHEVYFSENNTLNYLSEQLRNEITLQTCHKLVNKVHLFDGLPATVVGEILGRLHPEVFLPNDLVVRAPDIGTCMYFIANGCVAVYSLKGVEVCHLEDGAHFGEVALIMKDRKRVASVVAVETTQVYRLDEADFRHFVMSSPVLFERVESIASKRMHETVLLDEKYRRERERECRNASTTSLGDPSTPVHPHVNAPT